MRLRPTIFLAWLCAFAPVPSYAESASQTFDALIVGAKAAMMTSPRDALDRATLAEQAAASLPAGHDIDVARATAGWLKGEALMRMKRSSDAATLIDGSLRLVEKSAPSSKLVADLYRSRGNLEASLGQVVPAFRDFQRAHAIYRQINEPRGQAMALQNIGSIYSAAGDNERVLHYYAQSADAFSGDPMLTLSAYNNQAGALKKLGRLEQALTQYRAALGIARKLGSAPLQVQILTNLADAQVLAGKLDAADATLSSGFAIANGEAAEGRPFLNGVRARIEFLRGNVGAAAALIDRTFGTADLANTPADFRDFHETAYQMYGKLGDSSRALAHLEAFKRLDDQTRALTTSTSAALVAANFDFANQNLRITKLKAGQIARDATIEKGKARLNMILLMSALAVGLVALVLLSIGFVQSRRSRRQVEAANERLSNTNAALESALTAKTQFLATTSHEIRTPLNGILGMTEVILCDRSLAAPLRERLEVVHGAGKTMRALVDDILDVAKMEHGELTLKASTFALPPLMEDVARLWESQARAKGVDVVLDLADCPQHIVEDEARLRQIVFNLMSNAIKFTDRGAVRLTVSRSIDPTPSLTITIKDSGIGIPADKLEQIFESFQQIDGGTTRRFGGTGLGLAIVRNLARAMGGDVIVTSEMGNGSTFQLTLPLREQAVVASTGAALPPRRESLAESSVLVVERNPLTQGMMTAVLGKRVGAIAFASSVDEATSAASPETDHIVIDLQTIADGDVLATIGTLARAMPRASVTLLSPALSAAQMAEFTAAGIGRMLVKPVAPPTLLAALGEAHEAQQNLHVRDIGPRRAAA